MVVKAYFGLLILFAVISLWQLHARLAQFHSPARSAQTPPSSIGHISPQLRQCLLLQQQQQLLLLLLLRQPQ